MVINKKHENFTTSQSDDFHVIRNKKRIKKLYRPWFLWRTTKIEITLIRIVKSIDNLFLKAFNWARFKWKFDGWGKPFSFSTDFSYRILKQKIWSAHDAFEIRLHKFTFYEMFEIRYNKVLMVLWGKSSLLSKKWTTVKWDEIDRFSTLAEAAALSITKCKKHFTE